MSLSENVLERPDKVFVVPMRLDTIRKSAFMKESSDVKTGSTSLYIWKPARTIIMPNRLAKTKPQNCPMLMCCRSNFQRSFISCFD